MKNLYFNILGWLGAGIILIVYFLNVNKKLESCSKTYKYMNFLGSILLTMNAAYFYNYPFVLINVFWAFITLDSILNSLESKTSTF